MTGLVSHSRVARRDAATALPGSGEPTVPPSVTQLAARGRIRGILAMLGPAFVAAVAYVDPGNFATNFTAGAAYGYRLVWVVVLANLMAMPVQFLSAKVGIVTGRSLPEVCREHCRPVLRWLLWLQAELVAMATDLAEFIGAAIGLNLLFGVPPLTAGLITAVAAFAILALQVLGARPFERAICFLLLVILAGFGYQLFLTGVDATAAAAALVPRLPDRGAVYLAAGIVGATMMPHVIYLHSAMTSRRVRCNADGDRRVLLRSQRYDVLVALGLAGLINLSMLLIAARVFTGRGDAGISLQAVHHGLATVVGGGAALAFAVALLASGVSSSSVGTFAGQEVMSGFLRLRIPLIIRRLVTMAPALIVLALHLDATAILNLSQVVLSFGIPFALVPLVLVTSSRSIMGAFTNARWLTLLMTAVTVAVVTLNLGLLYSQFGTR